MNSPKKRIIGSVFLTLVIAGAFGIGIYIGARRTLALGYINSVSSAPSDVDLSPLWKTWSTLKEKYVATHKKSGTVTDQDMLYGAIKGLTASLGDPYTVFFPPQDNKDFQTQINGNFEGLGVEVGLKDNIITIIAPLKGTPAYNAGIKSGDQILKVNGKSTEGMTVDQATQIMRGKKGTSVTLTLLSQKDTQTHDITVVRDVINIPTIETDTKPGNIFVIRLYSFNENSASLFRDALQKFVNSGDTKLILDLRGNPGGYLDSAIDMASWFLPESSVVVKEDTGPNQPAQVFTSKGYNVFKNKPLKLVILVDAGSASASEILAGALHEHHVATLIGTRTFGKGSVQELIPITSDTSLKVTIARWLTPNGISISDQGLTPDITVDLTQKDLDTQNDRQLQSAVDYLNK